MRNIRSDKIHGFAIELLQINNPNKHALMLLISNYQRQDLVLIDKVIFKKQNKFSFHHWELDTLLIFKENIDPAAVELMLYIYNQGWCTYCREGFIDIMIANDWLPSSMHAELLHDCNLDIREKAKKSINPHRIEQFLL
ncbi:hypothetical protein [Paenibacillus sp. LPE1-1-1.1]|uniref:hypothetical protein n=1 Tax=Paenibacillus sp. LPE1-1-1.1 TaxID=3135230 RepID=UPI0034186B57